MDIKNKVAIITGASSGIGLATARLLSRKGAKVVLAARSSQKIKRLEKDLPSSYAVATDMTKQNQIKNLINKTKKKYGRIDILINNAGRGYDAMVEKIDPQKFSELFALNVIGPLFAMQQVLPVMKKQKSGMIVNISSGTSLMTIPGISAYSSIKRALNGLTLTAREELAKNKIKVSVVYPYITNTNFYKNKISFKKSAKAAGEENFYLAGDPAEKVAEKILEAIRTEEAEIYVREQIKNLR